jgi:hypothetical protein
MAVEKIPDLSEGKVKMGDGYCSTDGPLEQASGPLYGNVFEES